MGVPLKIDQATLNGDFGHFVDHILSNCYHNKPKEDKEKITKKSEESAPKQQVYVAKPITNQVGISDPKGSSSFAKSKNDHSLDTSDLSPTKSSYQKMRVGKKCNLRKRRKLLKLSTLSLSRGLRKPLLNEGPLLELSGYL
ncbi:hypothetical protein PanWU01x14_126450 [Parasponia andersonii]|uniref:Uncharacterized protein n=1 Tax=Parasponia andersonii TaxID=3476 RepID=A0A2P5CSV1_PARAD|nr:hypothetical protein PanWU01x14_126450 [Parasponia andersonii]